MANTFSALYYHFVFSTKNRHSYISAEHESRVWAFIGGIARKNGYAPIQIGGTDDHIHALISAKTSDAPSRIAQHLKGESSKWIHETFPEWREFAWQDGYGVFSVSKSNVDAVAQYIANQREHHRHRTFQDEYREFLKKHDLEFDERYIWG